MIVLKLLIQLFLKASLISLLICGLSLLAKADSSTKIVQLRPGILSSPETENQLLSLAESIEALKKATANTGNSSDSKLEIMHAIDGVGTYQFPAEHLGRDEMDNLITALLRLYGRDEDISAAVTNKLADLSKNIFSEKNRSGFNRFLSYQLELKISVSGPEDLPKLLSVLESIQTHTSQLDMLWLVYSKQAERSIRERIFTQIYKVLMDSDLHYAGQFSPSYLVAASIRRFLKENEERKIEADEVKMISDLIARFEKIKHIDSMSMTDVLRSLVRLTATHPEFEGKLSEYVEKSYQSKSLLDELQAQLDRGIRISDAQIRVLKSQTITDDFQKRWRVELLKTTETRNIFQIKRATPSCHSFYGL